VRVCVCVCQLLPRVHARLDICYVYVYNTHIHIYVYISGEVVAARVASAFVASEEKIVSASAYPKAYMSRNSQKISSLQNGPCKKTIYLTFENFFWEFLWRRSFQLAHIPRRICLEIFKESFSSAISNKHVCLKLHICLVQNCTSTQDTTTPWHQSDNRTFSYLLF